MSSPSFTSISSPCSSTVSPLDLHRRSRSLSLVSDTSTDDGSPVLSTPPLHPRPSPLATSTSRSWLQIKSPKSVARSAGAGLSSAPSTRVRSDGEIEGLMSLSVLPRDCIAASLHLASVLPLAASAEVVPSLQQQYDVSICVARSLSRWSTLSRHPLAVLSIAIIYLDRIKARHPTICRQEAFPDAILRLAFSLVLVAIKWVSEESYLNDSFVSHTPWSLKAINAMEKEALGYLQYETWVSPAEFYAHVESAWAECDVGGQPGIASRESSV